MLRGGSRVEGRAEVASLTPGAGFPGACSGLKLGSSPRVSLVLEYSGTAKGSEFTDAGF